MITFLNAAETTGAGMSKFSALFMNIAPFIFIFIVFYFLLIRPQKKKQQKLKELLNSIKGGDKVLLSSGMVGTVKRVKTDGYLIVEIANNVEVEVLKTSVVNVIK
ncbi:Preprotein translocase subunit YajC [Candidatus Hepatincolaceae symbiont of Richtersius coronifer]